MTSDVAPDVDSRSEPAARSWPHDRLVDWAEDVHHRTFGVDLHRYEVIRATPWATVLRWPVEGRSVWGKAVSPGFAAECGLLPFLAERSPTLVLAPIAVEPEHGWILLPDGGDTLEGIADVPTWTKALMGYAELQKSVVGAEATLLDLGCPDLRPHAAVRRLEQMMEAGHVPEHRRLVDAAAAVASRLDVDLVPATIQHDDLRPDNVLADGRVFDWGDSSLAHPFASLLTALMPNRVDRPGTAADKAEMRNDYLGSWQRFIALDDTEPPLGVLNEQADLAIMLAPIGRIDTWLRAPAAALERYPGAIDRWVQHMLATDWP